jgi:hypothetical protein
MKRRYLLIVMGLALAAGMLAGCSKKQGAQMNLYAPEGADFSVVLPGEIKVMQKESAQVDTPIGSRTMEIFTVKDGEVVFYASEMKLEMPQGAEIDVKNALANGLVSVVGKSGKILKQEAIQVNGNPGVAARIKTEIEGEEIYIQIVQVLTDKAQYQLQVHARDEKKLDGPDVQNYIGSLKITGEQPVMPAVAPAGKPSAKPAAGK